MGLDNLPLLRDGREHLLHFEVSLKVFGDLISDFGHFFPKELVVLVLEVELKTDFIRFQNLILLLVYDLKEFQIIRLEILVDFKNLRIFVSHKI